MKRTSVDVGKSAKKAKKSISFKKGWADVRSNEAWTVVKGPDARVLRTDAPRPKRKNGVLRFEDVPGKLPFTPNLTPRQVIEGGAFGGTYFRPIKSLGSEKILHDQHKEFDFFDDVDENLLTRADYDASINKFGVKCGGSLAMWESKGWISELDPYGWFQWYCRFYNGRRTTDDERQISRWSKSAGKKGRWKSRLVNSIEGGKRSPVISQVVWHWAVNVD